MTYRVHLELVCHEWEWRVFTTQDPALVAAGFAWQRSAAERAAQAVVAALAEPNPAPPMNGSSGSEPAAQRASLATACAAASHPKRKQPLGTAYTGYATVVPYAGAPTKTGS